MMQLRLIDEPAAEAIVAGHCPAGYRCTPDYPADGDRIAARLFLERMAAGVDPRPFGIFLICLDAAADAAGGAGGAAKLLVIGGIGFHGGIDASGRVEIGYGVVPSRQGCGHATAALGLLIAEARGHGASVLTAETEPGNLASRAVLNHQDFVEIGKVGETLHFELVLS